MLAVSFFSCKQDLNFHTLLKKINSGKEKNLPYSIGYYPLLTRMAVYWPCAAIACYWPRLCLVQNTQNNNIPAALDDNDQQILHPLESLLFFF